MCAPTCSRWCPTTATIRAGSTACTARRTWPIIDRPQTGCRTFGTRERISIAMDIFVKKQELPMYFGGPRWFVPGDGVVRRVV